MGVANFSRQVSERCREAGDWKGGAVSEVDAINSGREPAAILGSIQHDLGRLAGQHAELFQRELRDGFGEATTAMTTLVAGAGLLAVGGVLGSFMLVHGLNRASRLPLWGCYGLVGGLLASAGIGFVGAGSRRIAHVDFTPRETIAAFQDDLQWIMHQQETRKS
jgi:hypothetical protein